MLVSIFFLKNPLPRAMIGTGVMAPNKHENSHPHVHN